MAGYCEEKGAKWMRRIKPKGRHKNKKFSLVKAAVILVTCTVVGFLLLTLISDLVIRPVLLTAGISQAEEIATLAISDAVNDEIARSDMSYDNILKFQNDGNGNLKAVTTDSVKINLLKANMTAKILENLDVGMRDIELPLGNFISGELFSGRGPMLRFGIVPIGSVYTEFSTLFTQSGINQTKLQLMLNVTVTVSILMPVSSVDTNLSTSICVAETVIVGEVPSYYTQINEFTDNPSSKADIAANYGADKFADIQ